MRVEFNQGVPSECLHWLWKNIGQGNLGPGGIIRNYQVENDAWFYERVEQTIESTDPKQDSNVRYIPTITVKDPKKFTLFALRWS